jgi:hypothetical protein|tara:strand:- start:906 stop:1097 length:192 start_codon:yes stop_codon:yes gene_type:complete
MSFALSSPAATLVGAKRASVTGGRLNKTTITRRASKSTTTRAAVEADKEGAIKPFEVRWITFR